MLVAGTVILVLGVAFFVKYAFDNHWVNESARIVIGTKRRRYDRAVASEHDGRSPTAQRGAQRGRERLPSSSGRPVCTTGRGTAAAEVR